MNPLQKHGITKLSAAIQAAENKKNGITGDTDAIREKLKIIMAAVENPVPDRELPEDE